MTLTSDSTDSTATALVTVRVPRDSEHDLDRAAQRRLGRIDGINAVAGQRPHPASLTREGFAR
jgi:hypothetical protein